MSDQTYQAVDVRVRDVGFGAATLVATVLAVILESMWDAGWRVTVSTLILGLGVILVLGIWACLVRPNPGARITLPTPVPTQRKPDAEPEPEAAAPLPMRPATGSFPGVRSPGADFFRPVDAPPAAAEFAKADLFAPAATQTASAATTAVLPPVVHPQAPDSAPDDSARPKVDVRLVEDPHAGDQ